MPEIRDAKHLQNLFLGQLTTMVTMIRSNDPTPESIDRVLAVASVSINVTVNSTQCRMDASIMVVLGVFNAFVRNGDSLMSPARNAAPSWVIPTVRNRDAGTCADTPDHGMKPQMSATSVRNMISSSSGTRNRTVARNFGIT